MLIITELMGCGGKGGGIVDIPCPSVCLSVLPSVGGMVSGA